MPQSPLLSKKQSTTSTDKHAAQPQGSYDAIQLEEIEVLRSIYDDDFEDVETKKAWSKAIERSFKLKLRSNLNNEVCVVLNVTLGSTYPKSVPSLRLTNVSNVRPNALAQIQNVISKKPKALIQSGEVMIFELASDIQGVLDNEVSAQARNDQLPSLEEERAVREAKATEIARAEEELRLRLEEEQKNAQEKENHRRINEELRKREEAQQKRQAELVDRNALESTGSPFEQVTFDQAVSLYDEFRDQHRFRSVYLFRRLAKTPSVTVSTASPTSAQPNSMCFVIKRLRLPHSSPKSSILALEKTLERLKVVQHANIVNVLAFKLSLDTKEWQCDVLMDFATRGTLKEMLEMFGQLPAQRGRTCIIELLQALDFYHKHGIVHGRIHAGNVLFSTVSSGITSVKLADAGFATLVHDRILNNHSSRPARHLDSWSPPEAMQFVDAEKSRKTDIWDMGIVLVQMFLGLEITSIYTSPSKLISDAGLSEPFEDLLDDVFDNEPRRRPGSFDIIPYEFLRTDCSVHRHNAVARKSRTTSANQPSAPLPRRLLRSESSVMTTTASRYSTEWEEVGRLGKGGYGEVVKARNKLDGRIYAVKKISQKSPAELNQVLSEVYLLATLNHPYVVRYYTAWGSEEQDDHEIVDESVYTESTTGPAIVFGSDSEDSEQLDPMAQSTGGLDFISSSGYPKIEFGVDSDEEESDSDSGDSESVEDESSKRQSPRLAGKNPQMKLSTSMKTKGQRAKSFSRVNMRSTLYIQMEFCERLTLRDMIRKNMSLDDVWLLFRQVLEGLVHIHTHGIIHRDLKPENIFIDAANNPRIGDFGLATSSQKFIDAQQDDVVPEDDMTRNVGTTLYVAPELLTKGGGSYTDKIDMYSLGIILFEMSYPLPTAMERIQTLSTLRKKEHSLPDAFRTAEKTLQGEIITSLITHRPSERPTSTQLLSSGRVPVQVEDETIRLALKGLADDNSPYHHKIISALFSRGGNTEIKAQLWDQRKDAADTGSPINFLLVQSLVKARLQACFIRHGAVEVQRNGLFPRSDHYNDASVVQLLDASGTLVQLPHDLTLPYARLLAKQNNVAEKSFAFGMVYRANLVGIAPRSNREMDFDIVSHRGKDLALQEAEVIKVMDEVLENFPSLRRAPMCYHVSHSKLLDIILDFCRVSLAQRQAVKQVLGRLNIHQQTWAKTRLELRSASIAVSSTSLDELARFDFRETPESCLTRILTIFEGTQYVPQIHKLFTQMIGLFEYCQRLGIKRKIYLSPLSNFNESFYRDGIMFQCIFDTKKRDVLAAGGRYDSLIEEYRPRTGSNEDNLIAHGVGINIGFDTIVSSMIRHLKDSGGSAFLKKSDDTEHPSAWLTRRCDVLVASFDPSVLRSTGLGLISKLWANDISAELAVDVRSPEQLLTHYREDKHSWIVTIKHEDIASDKPDLKVKSVDKKADFDVRSSDLVNFLRAEIRDRDQREGTHERSKMLQRQASQPADSTTTLSSDRRTDVQVLLANHKSKKGNKWRIIEQAQHKAQELLRTYADGPIACVETRDEIVEMIRQTRLSDPEGWRRVAQDVNLSERQYVQEVWDLLKEFKLQYADSTTGQGRNCFLFNFRTGLMTLYDLLL